MPRFRALARMMVMERFCETTTLTADVPSSSSAINGAVWAAEEVGYHAHHVSQSDGSGFVPIATARRQQRAFSGVSPQPPLASEKRAKRDGDLPVLVVLVSRRECPRVAQCIPPEFDKFFDAVETLDERFDGSQGIGSKFPSLWSILMPLSRAKPFSRLQDFRQFDCGFSSIPFRSERSADGPLIVPSDICSVEGGCFQLQNR